MFLTINPFAISSNTFTEKSQLSICNGKNIFDVIKSIPLLSDKDAIDAIDATDALQLKTDFNKALPNIIQTFVV